ncbi:type III-B CRISPR module-associated Cmr3 family protein [Roseofilum sp. BLCC_M154]|uniref:Type III-B CRISPR module-associated Cmr3 family protein n=1 Tax=Roseofilum acuticapitatum BLCC-M154 TaxID=3022444 RepID=A0ABT7APS6_9CYAN|nr:type III-B CRISPR module-associated Cmr3 family protein [Roseofilum acuticapitatum]MDJ1168897.1 type III-B CRISPR module-associated Cmr3 family protein [Roseofilum acuticapitatum BLCC-M154]
MSAETKLDRKKPNYRASETLFEYLVVIRPLGLLYGSAGRFLSPDNLVGRSGNSFPPSAAALSGLFAHHLGAENTQLSNLQLAGPFWAQEDAPDNFYVPTPIHCLVKDNQIKYQMSWRDRKWQTYREGKWDTPPNDKFQSGTWIALNDWQHFNVQQDGHTLPTYPEVRTSPWKFVPHLHPRLKADERTTKEGDLFLENAVQLDPNACLVYLSNVSLSDGWYRFGGEGHLVEIQCLPLDESVKTLLNQKIDRSFAMIAPALWGSNRLSYREPMVRNGHTWIPAWRRQPEDPNPTEAWESAIAALLTQRATPQRHRLGKRTDGHQTHQPRLLSRGRYAVAGGSVYILESPLNRTWQDWEEAWFPTEGYSFKRWGCGLALPLESAISSNNSGGEN